MAADQVKMKMTLVSLGKKNVLLFNLPVYKQMVHESLPHRLWQIYLFVKMF